MKTLAKPEQFITVSPRIYGYENPGSTWRTKTSRRGDRFVTVHRCVATDCGPTRCNVGDVIVIWN